MHRGREAVRSPFSLLVSAACVFSIRSKKDEPFISEAAIATIFYSAACPETDTRSLRGKRFVFFFILKPLATGSPSSDGVIYTNTLPFLGEVAGGTLTGELESVALDLEDSK